MILNNVYSDLPLASREPLYNLNAVRQSVLVILNTQKGERLNNPEFGTNIEKLLFRKFDDDTLADLRSDIMTAIDLYEPRVSIKDINIEADEVNMTYNVYLSLQYKGEVLNLSFDLESKSQ